MNRWIYIPSAGRAGRPGTYERMPPHIQKQVWFVVPENEAIEYARDSKPTKACSAVGIAATREWILKNAARQGLDKIVMLDDDLTFQVRRSDGKITNASDKEWDAGLQWIKDRLSAWTPHCSWGTRFLGYDVPGSTLQVGRAMYCLAYHVPTLLEKRVSFLPPPGTKLPKGFLMLMEDFHVTLQLLRQGCPNEISLVYRVNPGASNAPGGCSRMRTAKKQTQAAQLLAKLHAPYVKLRPKKSWQGMEGDMYDVTVYWKKAYEESK